MVGIASPCRLKLNLYQVYRDGERVQKRTPDKVVR